MPAKRQPSRKTPARSANDRQAKLQTILEAALEVFLEKGFAEARLDEVAARAGYQRGFDKEVAGVTGSLSSLHEAFTR